MNLRAAFLFSSVARTLFWKQASAWPLKQMMLKMAPGLRALMVLLISSRRMAMPAGPPTLRSIEPETSMARMTLEASASKPKNLMRPPPPPVPMPPPGPPAPVPNPPNPEPMPPPIRFGWKSLIELSLISGMLMLLATAEVIRLALGGAPPMLFFFCIFTSCSPAFLLALALGRSELKSSLSFLSIGMREITQMAAMTRKIEWIMMLAVSAVLPSFTFGDR